MKNHLGGFECKLCLTLHNNEGSYLAHTQGKKHQANLARRAAKEASDQPYLPLPSQARVEPRKFVKIGRPGYKVCTVFTLIAAFSKGFIRNIYISIQNNLITHFTVYVFRCFVGHQRTRRT
jgi:hypothetical protein